MLAAAIKQLIQNTPRKHSKIISLTELDTALEPPLLFQYHISKPKEDRLLHYMRVYTPPIVRTFYDQDEQERVNILTYVQTLGLGNTYHPLDIDLLAEAAVKHYLQKTEHNFKEEELDLRNTLSNELKRLFVYRLKEPTCIAREWDELMAFMITGRYLYVGPLTAKDIERVQGMPGVFKESSSKGKEREPVTLQREKGSKHQQRVQQQTEGGDSVEKEAEYEPDEQGSDHQEDETTRTTPAPSGPRGDSSCEESHSELDRSRSLPPPTKPRKVTRRNCECRKSTEEQEWESLTGVIAFRRTTQKSKALKGMKLDTAGTLNGDDNTWKSSQRFDRCVNALERCLAFQDMDLNERSALDLAGFKVTNSALVLYNQCEEVAFFGASEHATTSPDYLWNM